MNLLPEFIAQFNSTKDPFEKSYLLLEAQKKGIKAKDIAKALGVNVSYLSHLRRLKKLPEMIVDGYYAGSISLSHLFVISRLGKKEQMISLYEKVLKDNLTVQETEAQVRNLLYKVEDVEGKYFPEEKLKKIIEILKSVLPRGVEVKIIQTRVKVKIVLQGKGNLKATNKFLEKFLKLLEDIKVKNSVDSRVRDF